MNIKSRIEQLEKQQPASQPPRMSDEDRMQRMKDLSIAIATEARKQGITAQDDPRLGLPLAIAEAITK